MSKACNWKTNCKLPKVNWNIIPLKVWSFACASITVVGLWVDIDLFKWDCHLKKHRLKTFVFVIQAEFGHMKCSGSLYPKRLLCAMGSLSVEFQYQFTVWWVKDYLGGEASVYRNWKQWHFVSAVGEIWSSEQSVWI